MSTLYELTAQRKELQTKLETLNLDEVTIADTLEGDSTELAAKIADYGYVIRNMESFVDAIAAEEKRLSDRRKANEKKLAHIKKWLLENMIACEISKIECPIFSITVKTNPGSVIVDNDKLIPDKYMVVPELPKPAPDKKMIAAAIKAGADVPGCHIEKSMRVEIK
jgi:hypothetical protein